MGMSVEHDVAGGGGSGRLVEMVAVCEIEGIPVREHGGEVREHGEIQYHLVHFPVAVAADAKRRFFRAR